MRSISRTLSQADRISRQGVVDAQPDRTRSGDSQGRQQGRPVKLARWGIDSHMGLLFGVANQVILAALALGVICMVIWGYRMWWLRRPTREGATGAAGPPGGAQRPSTGAVLVVGLAAIGLGVFLPVLGVSLLAFLLVDAARQARSGTTVRA